LASHVTVGPTVIFIAHSVDFEPTHIFTCKECIPTNSKPLIDPINLHYLFFILHGYFPTSKPKRTRLTHESFTISPVTVKPKIVWGSRFTDSHSPKTNLPCTVHLQRIHRGTFDNPLRKYLFHTILLLKTISKN